MNQFKVGRLITVTLLIIFSVPIRSQLKKTRVCVCMEVVGKGLKNPLIIQNAGDDTERIFIGEQAGIIHTFFKNGDRKYSKPLLDISNKTIFTGDERGLLGLAFHPKFKKNRRFFVYYSSKKKPAIPTYDHVVKISEYLMSKKDLNIADESSEKTIMEIEQPFTNHNGGEMIFGDDGYLYLFVGDGGSGGDPLEMAQNTSSLLGKVLRIDVDKNTGRTGYAIPRDNPFVNKPNFRPEIYAYGVRNIWRCGKDRGAAKTGRKKGRIMCGDVGQNKYEEVDLLRKGANYGWNAREGFKCYDRDLCGKIGREVLPVFSYSHSIGRSVIGGQFYRGCLNPRLWRFYIFGDWANGKLFRLLENQRTRKWDGRELSICKRSCAPPLTSIYGKSITSFGLDESGEIYMVSTGDSNSDKLYRIVDPIKNGNPSWCKATRSLRKRQRLAKRRKTTKRRRQGN